MQAANDDVEEISHFEILACSCFSQCVVGDGVKRTTFHGAMTPWNFQIAGTDVSAVCMHSMPAGSALLGRGLAENRALIVVEYSSLARRFLHRRRSRLRYVQLLINT